MKTSKPAPAQSPATPSRKTCFPQAFHITWGTYGGRLPGSAKKHVTPEQNQYATPLPRRDARREFEARDSMAQGSVKLTIEQRKVIEVVILEVAHRYGWTIHAIAPQSDHQHVIISAPRIGHELRDALKAVASKALNKGFGERTWWAEGGSAKYIWDRSYLANATKCVQNQRDF